MFSYPIFFHPFTNRRVTNKLNIAAVRHPRVLKRKSYQSAARVGVSVCCPISMSPLKRIGAMTAHGMRREALGFSWLLRYSNHRIQQKPKYMRKCNTLSMLVT